MKNVSGIETAAGSSRLRSGHGVRLTAILWALPVAAVCAAPVGERGKFPESGVRDLGEIRKTVPSQTLEKLTVAVRITRIEPNCVAAGKAFRVRGSGFGAVPGKRAIRIAGQVTQIRSWKDHLIVGTVPAVSPGQALTVELLGDGKQVLARGNTAACSVKVKSAPQRPARPGADTAAIATGKRQPKPSSMAKTPAPADGKALLEDLKARQGLPQVGASGLPTGKRQHKPFSITEPKTPAAAPPPGGSLEANRIPSSTAVGVDRTSTVGANETLSIGGHRAETLKRQRLPIPATTLPAPEQRQPLSGPSLRPGVGGIPITGVNPDVRESVEEAQIGAARRQIEEMVRRRFLQVNGSFGPRVETGGAREVDVSWNGVDAFVEGLGARLLAIGLVVGDETVSEADCRVPNYASLPDDPDVSGDGYQQPRTVRARRVTSLGLDTYTMMLCVRLDEGSRLSWYASQKVAVVTRVEVEVAGLVAEVQPLPDSALVPDLVVTGVRVHESGGGRYQIIYNFADAAGVYPEYARRGLGPFSFDWEVWINDSLYQTRSATLGYTGLAGTGFATHWVPPRVGRHTVRIIANRARRAEERSYTNNAKTVILNVFAGGLNVESTGDHIALIDLNQIVIHDDCDNVSPGDWTVLVTAACVDASCVSSPESQTLSLGDVNGGDTRRFGFVPLTIPAGAPGGIRVTVEAMDCDSDSPFVWPLGGFRAEGRDFTRHCGEELFEVSGGNDYAGAAQFTLTPDQLVRGGAFVSRSGSSECGTGAFTASISVR